MKLSEYKQLLDLIKKVEDSVKLNFNKSGIPYDSVIIKDFKESFVVLEVYHKGKRDLQYLNLWSIIEEKNCGQCGN